MADICLFVGSFYVGGATHFTLSSAFYWLRGEVAGPPLNMAPNRMFHVMESSEDFSRMLRYVSMGYVQRRAKSNKG